VRDFDVSRRLTAPDQSKTALLVREYAFDLNFLLFIDDHDRTALPPFFEAALWRSGDFNPETHVNFHEDLEWSNDSSVIAVIIDGNYEYAYDFKLARQYEALGTEDALSNEIAIQRLLRVRNVLQTECIRQPNGVTTCIPTSKPGN